MASAAVRIMRLCAAMAPKARPVPATNDPGLDNLCHTRAGHSHCPVYSIALASSLSSDGGARRLLICCGRVGRRLGSAYRVKTATLAFTRNCAESGSLRRADAFADWLHRRAYELSSLPESSESQCSGASPGDNRRYLPTYAAPSDAVPIAAAWLCCDPTVALAAVSAPAVAAPTPAVLSAFFCLCCCK
jgi:hypothetical protein